MSRSLLMVKVLTTPYEVIQIWMSAVTWEMTGIFRSWWTSLSHRWLQSCQSTAASSVVRLLSAPPVDPAAGCCQRTQEIISGGSEMSKMVFISVGVVCFSSEGGKFQEIMRRERRIRKQAIPSLCWLEERSIASDENRRKYNVQRGDPGVILKGRSASCLTVMHLIL